MKHNKNLGMVGNNNRNCKNDIKYENDLFLLSLQSQIGTLLGCVISLKNAVSGITIVALGTSLPDTFASRSAAMSDEYADAAIGNVTGKIKPVFEN